MQLRYVRALDFNFDSSYFMFDILPAFTFLKEKSWQSLNTSIQLGKVSSNMKGAFRIFFEQPIQSFLEKCKVRARNPFRLFFPILRSLSFLQLIIGTKER